MPIRSQFLIILLCLLATPMLAIAQEQPAKPASASIYVDMQPSFIVTFGGPGPLKYLRADVTLIVPDNDAEGKVKLHNAPLRNALVMLLSSQKSENVDTPLGRDKIRQQALEQLRQILVKEYGDPGYNMIKDLLFTSFIVQE